MKNKLINHMGYTPDKYIKHLYEHRHMNLLESGGVAAYEYSEQIEAIINSIKQINRTSDYIEINVNGSTDTKIKLSEKFTIALNFDKDCIYPYGLYVADKTDVKNNIVKFILFKFTVPDNITDETLLIIRRLMYHEFSHCKEDITRRINNKPNVSEVYTSLDSKIMYNDVTDVLMNINQYSDIEVEICTILYRLFVDTERNAIYNELYGELITIRNSGIKINRNNIKDIIFKHTESGQDYIYFRNIIDNYNKSDMWCRYAIPYFNKTYIQNKTKNNIHNFHRWFIKYAYDALRTVFKQMCKISETFLIVENKDYHDCLKLTDSINKTVNEQLSLYGYNKNTFNNIKTYEVNWNTKREKYKHITHISDIKVNSILIDLLENKKFR